MHENQSKNKLYITLGELTEAVSEIAFEYADNAKEAQFLSQLALVEILKKATFPGDAKRMLGKTFPYESHIN